MSTYQYGEHMVNTEKKMKLGYSKLLYNQRNKDRNHSVVIKRLFGEHLMSRLTRTQNRELSFRCITYNMHRLTNLIILMMFSTKPHILYLFQSLFLFRFPQQQFLFPSISNSIDACSMLNGSLPNGSISRSHRLLL